VSGDDYDFVGKRQKAVMDGTDELFFVTSGEVCSAYGTCEEGVSGDEQGLVREIKARAALGVAGGVEDYAGETGDGDGLVVGEVGVGRSDFRSRNAEPACLFVHHLDQGDVKLVIEDGGAGETLQLLGAGDVVDMSVGNHNLLEGELVAGERRDDAIDVVAGVDDDGFAGGLVPEDRAVALEGADYEDFVDHILGGQFSWSLLVDRFWVQGVEAVVLGFGEGKEGTVAKTGREGDGGFGVGPVDKVRGETGGVVLGLGVVVVVGEVAAGDGQYGCSLGPGLGEWLADVGPGAYKGGAGGGKQVFLERSLAFVFEDEVIASVRVDEGGIDDAVAGVEEYFRGGEGGEVLGRGGPDTVVQPAIA
jgi:hypothetical protein